MSSAFNFFEGISQMMYQIGRSKEEKVGLKNSAMTECNFHTRYT